MLYRRSRGDARRHDLRTVIALVLDQIASLMARLSFIFAHLIVAVGLAATAYIFGRRITWSFAYQSAWEEISFSVVVGLGVLSYAVLLIGLLGLLYRWLVLLLLGAGIAACQRVWLSWPTRAAALWRRVGVERYRFAGVALLGTVALLPIWLLLLYPPVSFDATMYHLALPKVYLQAHRVVFDPYLRCAAFPQTNEMLFTLSMLLYDDITAQLVEFVTMIVLIIAIIGFGRRFFSLRAGAWSAAILIQSPIVLALGTTGMVDVGLALPILMSVYALSIWLGSEEHKWLVLAGAMCGLAIGTKYPGLFFLAAFTGFLIYTSVRRGKNFASPLRFLLAVLAVASPWFLRSFYYTRNPLFPFFYTWFARWFGWGQWKPEYQGVFVDLNGLGMGKSLKALLSLPWNLAVHPAAFGGGFVSPICLILPIIFLFFRCLPGRARAILALGLAYGLFWFLTAQGARYLLPALPLLSLAAGAGLDRFCSRFLRRPAAGRLATVAIGIAMMSPGFVWACNRIRERGPVPHNQPDRYSYLAARLPAYPALKFLNDRLGSAYTVYGFGQESMAYFADGLFMGDHFGPARYSLIQDKLTDPEALCRVLNGLGSDYLLIVGDYGREVQKADKDGRLKLIYSADGVLVFDLSGCSTPNNTSNAGPTTLLSTPDRRRF
jgi:hypothetical protein